MEFDSYRMSTIPEENSLYSQTPGEPSPESIKFNKKNKENSHGQISPIHQKTLSQQLTADSENWSVVIPEDIYKIKNLDTGEIIDIRDENQETFPGQFKKILDLRGSNDDLEEFYRAKRKMNNSLWEAVERNDINRCKELLDKEEYGDMIAQTNTKGLND